MDNNLIPFWEKTYQDDTTNAFSAAPNATLKEFEHRSLAIATPYISYRSG